MLHIRIMRCFLYSIRINYLMENISISFNDIFYIVIQKHCRKLKLSKIADALGCLWVLTPTIFFQKERKIENQTLCFE